MSSKQRTAAARRMLAVGAAAALAGLAAGCGPAARPGLLLYCGAGVRPPVAEAAERFQRRTGAAVECHYAGSEVLLSTIKLSGEGDLYLPGDIRYVDQAAEAGLVASRRTICYFVPVILVRKGNPLGVRAVRDLLRPEVKLGLGDPQACVIGRVSRQIFEKNGVPLEEVERRTAYQALTVNDLGEKVKLGALDAVIVWDATAAYYRDDTEVVPIPLAENVISTVAVAVLTSSSHRELAEQFADYLVSPEGRAVFKRHGYSLTLPE